MYLAQLAVNAQAFQWKLVLLLSLPSEEEIVLENGQKLTKLYNLANTPKKCDKNTFSKVANYIYSGHH